MTDTEYRRNAQQLAHLAAQITALEHRITDLAHRLAPLLDALDWCARIEAQIAELAACIIDGTPPAITPPVQARLAIHRQDQP